MKAKKENQDKLMFFLPFIVGDYFLIKRRKKVVPNSYHEVFFSFLNFLYKLYSDVSFFFPPSYYGVFNSSYFTVMFIYYQAYGLLITRSRCWACPRTMGSTLNCREAQLSDLLMGQKPRDCRLNFLNDILEERSKSEKERLKFILH